ncbi:MAG: YIP1 family protein [Candidatus Saganbacteria bacterium]|nr:YIP1 family protein [Candidatus Saganbacteria bacterium]
MKEILARARQIILQPKETWRAVKAEHSTVPELFINYAAPLALIPAVATLIGLSLVGMMMPTGHVARAHFTEALAGGVLGYVFHLLGLLAGAWVVSFLSPYFESRSDLLSAVKLVLYSMTPVWLIGVVAIFPSLGLLQIFGLYSVYLLYTGLPVVMETSPDQALWYTVAIMIAALVISLALSIIVGGAVYGPMFIRMMAE